MKKQMISLILFGSILAVAGCTRRGSQDTVTDACAGVNVLDIPNSALFGQWRESELVEMKTGDTTGYWLRRNHVLSREGQLTTREEFCADAACAEVKAEMTHFGSYVFDARKHSLQKSYRNHFYAANDAKWMSATFALEKCPQSLATGEVITLNHPACLEVLNVKNEESWRLEGATLKSLALRNCGPQLRADAHLTRELVRMF